MEDLSVNDVLGLCAYLVRSPYSYSEKRALKSFMCNGHECKVCDSFWHSISIDNQIIDLGVFNSKYRKGSVHYYIGGEKLNSLQYVKFRLTGKYRKDV